MSFNLAPRMCSDSCSFVTYARFAGRRSIRPARLRPASHPGTLGGFCTTRKCSAVPARATNCESRGTAHNPACGCADLSCASATVSLQRLNKRVQIGGIIKSFAPGDQLVQNPSPSQPRPLCQSAIDSSRSGIFGPNRLRIEHWLRLFGVPGSKAEARRVRLDPCGLPSVRLTGSVSLHADG